ncbi:MAG: hypothetical protein JST77_03895 [Acidobacteria bacterium]|nr:hypothetical protein [Acidobacteriota bacterium]
MPSPRIISHRKSCLALAAALPCAFALASRAASPDEPEKALVGVIEGDSISVQGPMTVRVVNGQVKTVLRSGGDVRVKSGRATIDLMEGGRIAICGPAHLSVLKSGTALTVALDSGTIHTFVMEDSLTVYTALLQAKPLAIGGAARDTVVGLDSLGALSVRAIAGAVRIEQQLTGQSIVVPQNSDLLLSNGQLNELHPGAGHASCELGEMKLMEPAEQVSVPATTEEIRQHQLTNPKPNIPVAPVASVAAPDEGPTYKVYLAPMRYDKNLKTQQPPDPSLIVLVRHVRVRPTLIFEGRVEGEALVAEDHAAAPAPVTPNTAPAASATTKPPANNPTVANRVRTFLKRIWDRNS